MEEPTIIAEYTGAELRPFASIAEEYRWHGPTASPFGSGLTIAEEIMLRPSCLGLRSVSRLFTSRAELRRGH